MNSDPVYPYPPVFTVDAPGHLPQHQPHLYPHDAHRRDPVLVPCWNFPPARTHSKKRSCGGFGSAAGTLLVMILVVIFTALGLGAFQIMKLQEELALLKREVYKEPESISTQRLVANQQEHFDETKHAQTAAHLIYYPNTPSETLRWRTMHGQAFVNGVSYRDGGLQVNETGVFYIYSRLEFLSNRCNARDSLSHTVYLKRKNKEIPLMKDLQQGFCKNGDKEVWTSSSNLGSIQELKQGDRVFVNVSQPTLVSLHYDSNYFGLFKLP